MQIDRTAATLNQTVSSKKFRSRARPTDNRRHPTGLPQLHAAS